MPSKKPIMKGWHRPTIHRNFEVSWWDRFNQPHWKRTPFSDISNDALFRFTDREMKRWNRSARKNEIIEEFRRRQLPIKWIK